MSTQDPRWTPEAVEVVTAAIRKHTDRLLAADGEHGPRLSCTCGGLDYDLMQPDLAPAMAAYRLHRAEAVLGALADAGLLVAAGPAVLDDALTVLLRQALGYHWRDPATGSRYMLDPADVQIVLPGPEADRE